ncbi:hypothetical protein MMC06_003217 [Schaereria dolodes]|nr:hypothetical protein [Schaereria dolodes]
MSTLTVPDSPFQSIINFRDVGQTINHLTGKSILQEGRLFRSARPDEASPKDKQSLVRTHCPSPKTRRQTLQLISHPAEQHQRRQASPDPRRPVPRNQPQRRGLRASPVMETQLAELDVSTALLLSESRPSELISASQKTPLLHAHRPPNGRYLYPQHSSDEPTGPGGSRTGHAFAQPLGGFADLPDSSFFGRVSCSGTLYAGIPHAAISADYVASEEKLLPEREERLEEIKAVGFREEFAGCPEGFAESVIVFLENGWGGVEEYLEGIGIDKKLLEQVKRNLIEDKST